MTHSQGAMHQHDEELSESAAGAVEAGVESADHEVEEEMHDVEDLCLCVQGQDLDKARELTLERLKSANGAAGRVQFLSKVLDWGCLDALIGTVFPEAGDLAMSLGEITYLLTEANLAGMEKKGQAKIAFYQLVDLAIGLIPVAGDAADFLYMANRKSAVEFEKLKAQRVQEALAAGVSQEEIDQILAKGELIRKGLAVADQVVQVKKAA
jgi:hypothetical protein